MRRITFLAFILLAANICAQMRIVSYNVENLFDTKHDSLKLDEDYTPDGKYRWTHSRYQRKIENISRVIVNVGEWETAAVVGLCEIENEKCLQDLLNKGGLRRLGYTYVHQESPDQRGIDCALLYNPKMFNLINTRFIPVPLPESERPTRDIVYASGEVNLGATANRRARKDTLHIMMCHLPSQLGGTRQTEFKRAIAHKILQRTVDSILHTQPYAKIIIMGDMNAKPTDHIRGMHNLMVPLEEEGKEEKGTHKWQGLWSYLDQFYVSGTLLKHSKANVFDKYWLLEEDRKYGGTKPLRCYYEYIRWQPGYSDHLPIYLDIQY